MNTKLPLILFSFVVCQGNLLAQNKLDDLTADQYQALEQVTAASVTGTISFLASDELKGRGTPSPEFDIAAAYVASRFRAAGAKGLGHGGSYFVENEVDTVRLPANGSIVLGEKLIKSALLYGNDMTVDFSGQLQQLDWSNTEAPKLTSDVVVYDLPAQQTSGGRFAMSLRPRLKQLSAAGAKAVVLLCEEGNSLWGDALLAQDRAQLLGRSNLVDIPVVLLEKSGFESSAQYRVIIQAAIKQKKMMRNVAAVISGNDPEASEEAIVFSAHLDHLGYGGAGEDKIFNGADDDASGVTAVVTLADAFGALESKPARSLVFVAYWGEERGLLGSKQMVLDSPWPLEKIVANVNIEMIGRPEQGADNKMWMTGWKQSDLGQLMALGSRRVGVELFEHPKFSAMLYRASDNYSFVRKDVIAHSFSAGSLHQDYHQPSDEWTKLKIPHMTQIIRGIYAGSLPLAEQTLTPTASKTR